jgi:xylulokinase
MFMLCCKNGGLARERIRDSINEFSIRLGLYFPLPEIMPNVRAGTWRFYYDPSSGSLNERSGYWKIPRDDARLIVESQLLSLRLHSQSLVHAPNPDLPPLPRRIYLVGGGSLNPIIVSLVGEVLGGAEGVYRLDVDAPACALGAAHRAAWSVERNAGEAFEKFIGERWKEEDVVKRVGDGYNRSTWEYGRVLKGFEEAVLEAAGEGSTDYR